MMSEACVHDVESWLKNVTEHTIYEVFPYLEPWGTSLG